jgi:hypothetical protein
MQRSGFALDERAARALNRRGRQSKWVALNAVNYRASPHQAEMISGEEKPPLPMVRCHA